MERIEYQCVARGGRTSPPASSHTTQVLRCLRYPDTEGQVFSMDQEKNKEVPRGYAVAARLFCFNGRAQ